MSLIGIYCSGPKLGAFIPVGASLLSVTLVELALLTDLGSAFFHTLPRLELQTHHRKLVPERYTKAKGAVSGWVGITLSVQGCRSLPGEFPEVRPADSCYVSPEGQWE